MLTLSKSLSFETLLHYFYDYLASVHRGDHQGQSSDPTVDSDSGDLTTKMVWAND